MAYNQARRHPFHHPTLEEIAASTIRVQENNLDTILALAHRTFGAAFQFVPPMSVTLGLRECLSARKVRVFSDTGAWKQTALRVALFSEPTPEYPMTLLQRHPDALVTATLDTARHPIAEHPEWELSVTPASNPDRPLAYERLVGVGGIGTGLFFALEGAHDLGRDESRPARLLDVRDYCKLHIVAHYPAVLLGARAEGVPFHVLPVGAVGADEAGRRLRDEMSAAGMDVRFVRDVPGRPTLLSVCFQYPDGSGGNITTSDSAAATLPAGGPRGGRSAPRRAHDRRSRCPRSRSTRVAPCCDSPAGRALSASPRSPRPTSSRRAPPASSPTSTSSP